MPATFPMQTYRTCLSPPAIVCLVSSDQESWRQVNRSSRHFMLLLYPDLLVIPVQLPCRCDVLQDLPWLTNVHTSKKSVNSGKGEVGPRSGLHVGQKKVEKCTTLPKFLSLNQ